MQMYENIAVKFKYISTDDRKNSNNIHNVSFDINRGETVAFLQRYKNVSKDNIIMDVISGEADYSFGTVRINGKIAVLKNLQGMFNNRCSGRKNIYMICEKIGIGKDEAELLEENIVRFSELENEIDGFVKEYSDDMKSRLAYSIGMNVSCEILMVDNTFAISNEKFKKKLNERVEKFIQQKKSLIMFNPDIETAKNLCKRGIVLNNGRIIADENINKAVKIYESNI